MSTYRDLKISKCWTKCGEKRWRWLLWNVFLALLQVRKVAKSSGFKKETCFLPLFSMWSLSVTTLAVISVRMRKDVKTFKTIASIFNLEKVVKSARNLVTTTVGTHYPEVRIWSKLICFVKFYLLIWKDWPIIIDLLAMHYWISSHPKTFRLQKFQIFPWHKFTKLKTIREWAKAHATNINSQTK